MPSKFYALKMSFSTDPKLEYRTIENTSRHIDTIATEQDRYDKDHSLWIIVHEVEENVYEVVKKIKYF